MQTSVLSIYWGQVLLLEMNCSDSMEIYPFANSDETYNHDGLADACIYCPKAKVGLSGMILLVLPRRYHCTKISGVWTCLWNAKHLILKRRHWFVQQPSVPSRLYLKCTICCSLFQMNLTLVYNGFTFILTAGLVMITGFPLLKEPRYKYLKVGFVCTAITLGKWPKTHSSRWLGRIVL